jgi:dehypoxanthine futalosine cyclase
MSRPVRLAVVEDTWGQGVVRSLEQGTAGDRFLWSAGSAEACASKLLASEADLALLPAASVWRLLRDHGPGFRIVPKVAVSFIPEATSLPGAPGAAEDPEDPEDPEDRIDMDDALAFITETGLPFVASLWVGRSDAVDAEQAESLADVHTGAEHLPHSVQPGTPSERSGRPSYRLGAQELSGLAAYFDRLTASQGGQPIRVRLFEFAYRKETPSEVVWPRRARSSEPSLDTLLADASAGVRLAPDRALRLLDEAPLLELGRAADQRRHGLHPGNVVTYIIDRNVNYTNLCITACKFCNFYRPPKSKAGYTLSREILAEKFAETVAMDGIQILLQGGVNPALPLSYYEDLFRWTKANFPLALHALSPEEVSFIARNEGRTIRDVLERLVTAGMDSLPGGGAEILDDEIRHKISPLKCSTSTWLDVMREAHAIGLRTTGTMVFGFGENPGHVVRHLERLRALQDRTSGFTAFICWPFQAEGTRLRLGDDTTAQRYLRVFSLARLYLDNFPNLQVSWPTMGPDIGQIALRFGGNDFGSAMIEENVVSQAGAVFKLSAADIERCVRAAGFVPRRRNMRYELLPQHDRPARQPRALAAGVAA